jgi:hypothetical protein
MSKGEAAWVKPKSINLSLIQDIFIKNKKYFNKIKLMTDKIYFGKQKEYIIVE